MSSENEGKKGDPGTYVQEFQHGNVGARVPEKLAKGVFSTGVLVLQGASEFVLDFVLRMNQPHQVVARVVMPNHLVPQFIDALKSNLENYSKAFGPIPPPPTGQPPAKPPSIDEIYQDLKISEDVQVGAYTNAVMVVHSPSDFCLEFIAQFYPRSMITARVFMSIPQMPVLLNTMTQSWGNFQAKLAQQQAQQHKPPSGPPHL
jgi:Protein of unknown function (DUF3467)